MSGRLALRPKISSAEEVSLRHSENAFYAVGIAYSDLDMCFRIEARARIDGFPLWEYCPHRFDEAALTLVDRVQVFDHGAVELSTKAIAVLW